MARQRAMSLCVAAVCDRRKRRTWSAATIQILKSKRAHGGKNSVFTHLVQLHEPPLSPPCGERAGRGVANVVQVPMHAEKRKGASHEPAPSPLPTPRPSPPPRGRRCPKGR